MKCLITLALFAGIAGAQSNPTPLTGAWRVVEVTTTGQNAGTISNPQPGLYLFTGKYYSIVRDRSDKPRPDLSSDPTDAELLASMQPVQAQSGTYEVSGATVTMHPLVAKSPNIMHSGESVTRSFKLEGKTLALTGMSNARGPGAVPTTLKLTRVE
jgi:hypothetical protein